MAENSTKSVIAGLSKTTAAALSYVLGPLTGVFFYLMVKDEYVRFHAAQSIVVFGIVIVLQWAFTITIVLVTLVPLLSIIAFILWLVLIYKAWMGEEWEVPLLGVYARKLTKKVK